MNQLVHTNQRVVTRILPPSGAEKLANLYLPVHLRDFYLACHPLVQCFLFDSASCPEEFFTLVQQEAARYEKLSSGRRYINRDWAGDVKSKEVEICFDDYKQLQLSDRRHGP